MRNQNFDFETFASNAIKQVDEIRSTGGITIGGKAVVQESRINAFYRLLGLPAIIRYNEIKDSSERSETNTDPLNTGNNFKSEVMGATPQERQLFAIRNRGAIKPVTSEEAKAFMNANQAKLSHGILPFEDNLSRKRGLLFPMFVDGEAQIFPQEKRVASPFSVDDGDAVVDGVRYRIPFLEILIALRLKGDGVYSEAVQESINNLFPGVDTSNLNLIEGKLIDALQLALNSIIEIAHKTIKSINQSANRFSAPAIPPGGLNLDELITFSTEDSSAGKGTSEQRQGQLDSQERINSALLTIVEYDNSFNSNAVKNVKEGGLTGSLLGAINGESEEEKKESERESEKAKQTTRKAFRSLESLLGTFGGLSGVDVVVIMLAMMRVSKNDLYGLLNEESKLALETIKTNDKEKKNTKSGANERPITGNATMPRQAVDNLQAKVTEIYEYLDSQVAVNKQIDKAYLKRQGEA